MNKWPIMHIGGDIDVYRSVYSKSHFVCSQRGKTKINDATQLCEDTSVCEALVDMSVCLQATCILVCLAVAITLASN